MSAECRLLSLWRLGLVVHIGLIPCCSECCVCVRARVHVGAGGGGGGSGGLKRRVSYVTPSNWEEPNTGYQIS